MLFIIELLVLSTLKWKVQRADETVKARSNEDES